LRLEDGHDVRSGFWKRLDRRSGSVIFGVKPKRWRGYLLVPPLLSTLVQRKFAHSDSSYCVCTSWVRERGRRPGRWEDRGGNKRTRLLITRHPSLAPLIMSVYRPRMCANNFSLVSISGALTPGVTFTIVRGLRELQRDSKADMRPYSVQTAFQYAGSPYGLICLVQFLVMRSNNVTSWRM